MNKEWKEMQDTWARTNSGGPDVDEILTYVVKRSEKFDRGIRWENRIEWLGTLVGLVFVVKLMSMVESPVEIAFGISIGAFLVGLKLHYWLKGYSKWQVDPSLSRPLYRATLEKKFNKQIRLMRNAKYWFVLPLVVTGSTTAWAYLLGDPAEMDWFFFPLILVGTMLSWWAIEAGAVKSVRSDWEKVRRALDDGEML
jgi:hypothetical protein